LVGCNASRVHVQTYHATNQVVADLLLPRLFRSGEGNLDFSRLLGLQLDGVLGVLSPGKVVLLLLILLVVEMAATCSPGFPLARDDLVSRIFKLLNFNGSTAVDYMK
jgi:hypothetical protein